ncbi:MAG: glycosyltransferase family 4 protein [Alphaproteobacteria bacterium]|nr:glycosyltransferase family 4 protein [Alphaproteobacteria bacterium]
MAHEATIKDKPVILQVLPAMKSGGVERGTIEIAGAISRAGWTSLVASEGGPLVRQLVYVKAEHLELPLATKSPLGIWNNAGLLEQVIREYKVSLIHARSRAPAWSAYIAAKRTGIPFVTTFHGVYKTEGFGKKWYNGVMLRGNRVITTSQFITEHVLETYQPPVEKLRLIPRGVDGHIFHPAVTSPHRLTELVKQWRVPDDVPVLLMPGRITRWKGHELMIEALKELKNERFLCLFVGDGEQHPKYRKELEDKILDAGLGEKIRFVGATPFIAEAYMLAHAVACPSIEPEAFGRVAVEAQAMGRPVIATAHGGAMETVVDGATGWLVTPGDPLALAEALRNALKLSEEQRANMGLAAMQHVHANFSADLMCDRTMMVYEELLNLGHSAIPEAAETIAA